MIVLLRVLPDEANGDILLERKDAILLITECFCRSTGKVKIPVCNQSFGAGKTILFLHYLRYLNEYIKQGYFSNYSESQRLILGHLKNSTYIYVKFGRLMQHETLQISSPLIFSWNLITRYLIIVFRRANVLIADDANVDAILDCLSTQFGSNTSVFIHFDEVGAYSGVSSDFEVYFLYSLMEVGLKFKNRGHFFCFTGRSDRLHLCGKGLKIWEGLVGSVSPAIITLIPLPLLSQNAILTLFNTPENPDISRWINSKSNLKTVEFYSGGVPRLVMSAIAFLCNNINNLHLIPPDYIELWEYAIKLNFFISHTPASVCKLIELSWANGSFNIDATLEDESVSSLLARYSGYFTIINQICKIVFPHCLIRHWTSWQNHSLLTTSQLSNRGDKLEKSFSRSLELRFMFEGNLSWKSVGLPEIDQYVSGFSAQQIQKNYSFPKIVSSCNAAPNIDIIRIMEYTHGNLAVLPQNNRTNFNMNDFASLCQRMEVGQLYHPEERSHSGDCLLRLSINKLLHFQQKNFEKPFNLNLCASEAKKCNVKGFSNYLVIICPSGYDNDDGNSRLLKFQFIDNGIVDVLVLSKSKMESFFGPTCLSMTSMFTNSSHLNRKIQD